MVDIDRPITGISPAHAAGLRRLSARASASTTSSSAPSSPAFRNGISRSFAPLAESILSHLKSSGVIILPGLSPREFALLEADLAISFPPDLRAVLSLGVPSAPGFPDWRSPSALPHLLRLPSAALSLHISRHSFWHRSWGPRPPDDCHALSVAHSALRRAPPLLPLFDRCYLPTSPSLAGNPVLLVDDSRISVCALDLADFFARSSCGLRRSLDSATRTPRWVEFWSDAAACDRRRCRSSASSSSSCSSSSSGELSSPEDYVEIRTPRLPRWVGEYLEGIGEVLRSGGWPDEEVKEMVNVPPAVAAVDGLVIYEEMLLKTDAFSASLRRAGWSTDDVAEALGLHLRPPSERRRREVVLPPEIARKVGELAASVSIS